MSTLSTCMELGRTKNQNIIIKRKPSLVKKTTQKPQQQKRIAFNDNLYHQEEKEEYPVSLFGDSDTEFTEDNSSTVMNNSNELFEKRHQLVNIHKKRMLHSNSNNDNNTNSKSSSIIDSNKLNDAFEKLHALKKEISSNLNEKYVSTFMKNEKDSRQKFDSSSLLSNNNQVKKLLKPHELSPSATATIPSLNENYKRNKSPFLHDDDDYLVNKTFNQRQQPNIINDISSDEEEMEEDYDEETMSDQEEIVEKKKVKLFRRPSPIKKFNPYLLFDYENRKRIMKANKMETTGKRGDICKLVAQEYNALPEKEKQRYKEKSLKLKQEFREKLQPKEKKLPATGYHLYFKDMTPKIKAEHPEYSFRQLSKVVGRLWTRMTKEEQQKYINKSQELRAKFREEHPELADRLARQVKKKRAATRLQNELLEAEEDI
ncbi:hypothetical protein BDC45DRAFT_241819 [Circinella umbellata]|nr:hypothetical protein BDC45DRAFT_241819 [Circinella umbellata]